MIWLSLSVLLNGVLAYTTWNILRKLESQEEYTEHLEGRIGNFFISVQNVLADMRALDNREMFEKDDEVGTLFTQLTVILGELRVLIYGEEEEE